MPLSCNAYNPCPIMRAMERLIFAARETCHTPTYSAYANSIEDCVKNNYDIIDREENLIGAGCASKVYGFKLDDKSLALKEYHDTKRCRSEVAFLGMVSCLGLPTHTV